MKKEILFNAIERKDAEAVRAALAAGISPRVTDNSKTKKTPLHYAVTNGWPEGVRILLEHNKTEVNATNSTDETPLNCAVNGEFAEEVLKEILRLLLNHPKIDVNTHDQQKNGPLHNALIKQNFVAVDALSGHPKTHFDIVNKNGHSPIHLTIFYNYTQILLRFLNDSRITASILNKCTVVTMPENEEGASWSAPMSPLHFAVHMNRAEIVRLFLTDSRILYNCEDEDGDTALHIAVKNNSHEIIDALVQNPNVDVNLKNKFTISLPLLAHQGAKRFHAPIHLAAILGHNEALDVLLRRPDIDVNLPGGNSNFTALHYACLQGHAGIVQKLFCDPRTNINALDNLKDLPLHLAVVGGNPEVLATFLTGGSQSIDVNAKNEEGTSALFLASILWISEGLLQTTRRKIGLKLNRLLDLDIPSNCDTRVAKLFLSEHETAGGVGIYSEETNANIARQKLLDPLLLQRIANPIFDFNILHLLLNDRQIDINSSGRNIAGFSSSSTALENVTTLFDKWNSKACDFLKKGNMIPPEILYKLRQSAVIRLRFLEHPNLEISAHKRLLTIAKCFSFGLGENTLLQIHSYLCTKKKESEKKKKPISYVIKLENFAQLLRFLSSKPTIELLRNYLSQPEQSFKHHRFFQRDRYHNARAHLEKLTTENLHQTYLEYIAALTKVHQIGSKIELIELNTDKQAQTFMDVTQAILEQLNMLPQATITGGLQQLSMAGPSSP